MTFEEKLNTETTQKSDCNYLEREPCNQETKKLKKTFFCKIDKKTLYFLSLTDFYTDNLHNYGFSILDKSVGN